MYGKLGMYRSDSELTSNTPLIPNESESTADLTFGFGVRWDFTKNLAARAEYQLYNDVGGGDLGRSDAEVISVGAIWKF